MAQQGQVFKLKTRGADGKPTWAYRYRARGRGSARPPVGGFASQGEALQSLQVALERLRRRKGRLATFRASATASGSSGSRPHAAPPGATTVSSPATSRSL
jgi:hypothetical protein